MSVAIEQATAGTALGRTRLFFPASWTGKGSLEGMAVERNRTGYHGMDSIRSLFFVACRVNPASVADMS